MTLINRFFIGIASAMLVFSLAQAKPSAVKMHAPKPLPILHYLDENGKNKTLATAAHSLTVLHFWATWCAPCVKELPELDAQARIWKPQRIQVIALAMDGAKIERIKDFYKAHGITTLSANHDPGMAALRAVGGSGLPLTVFINAKGEEVARIEGPAQWNGMVITK